MTTGLYMHYIDVRWRHQFDAEPVRLMSELDASRFETRKLAFFRDGRVGYADAFICTHDTALGTVAVPALADINGDIQFQGQEIGREAFEVEWRRAVGTADEGA